MKYYILREVETGREDNIIKFNSGYLFDSSDLEAVGSNIGALNWSRTKTQAQQYMSFDSALQALNTMRKNGFNMDEFSVVSREGNIKWKVESNDRK